MKKYSIAALVFLLAGLGGCSAMGNMAGTGTAQNLGPYSDYMPIDPKSPWFSE